MEEPLYDMGGYEAKERKNRGKVQISLEGVSVL